MKSENVEQIEVVEELPDSWWYRVYLGVIITTVLVISALWAFSRFFSS
ncbi:MAG: hypothetical protein M3388_18285 [Acidobacteriota bacterium]|nr:hypothetical protein [Acidobacteriota bacterium]